MDFKTLHSIYLRTFPVKYIQDIWTYTFPTMHWGGLKLLFFSAIGNKEALGNVGFQDIFSLAKLNLPQIDQLRWDF